MFNDTALKDKKYEKEREKYIDFVKKQYEFKLPVYLTDNQQFSALIGKESVEKKDIDDIIGEVIKSSKRVKTDDKSKRFEKKAGEDQNS